MRTEQRFVGGSIALEGVARGEHGARDNLGTEHDFALEQPHAERGGQAELGAARVAEEVVGARVQREPERRGIDERAERAGEQEVRADAHVPVARVRAGAARGQEDLGADGERGVMAVVAEEPHVGVDAQVPHARGIARGRRQRDAAERDGVAVGAVLARVVDGDREVDGEPKAAQKGERRADVAEELVPDDRDAVVARERHRAERARGEVEDDAEGRGARRTAKNRANRARTSRCRGAPGRIGRAPSRARRRAPEPKTRARRGQPRAPRRESAAAETGRERGA